MNQKSLCRTMNITVLSIGICGLVFYFLATPYLISSIFEKGSVEYWMQLAYIWISAIPCYTVLALCRKIIKNIETDNSFSKDNAKLCNRISLLAVIDTVYILIGLIAFLIANLASVEIIIVALIIIFIGIAVAVIASSISQLTVKAALLQEQSDLTI